MAKFGWTDRRDEHLDKVYVATHLERRALRHRAAGSLKLATDLLEQALAIRQENAPGTEFNCLDELGKTYMLQHDFDRAIDTFQRAIELIQRDYYDEHPLIAPILDDWAFCCIQQGQLTKAESLCQHSLAIKQKSLLPQDVKTLETMRTLAEIHRRLERYPEAEKLLMQALKIVEPATIAPVEEFYYELALLYQDQAKYDEAERYFRLALPIFANRGGKRARFATGLKSFASLLRATDRGREAERLDYQASEILEELRSQPPIPHSQNVPGSVFFDGGLYPCTIVH
jgi:tetratricopeptide (TPR) repeat protein